MKKHLMTLGLMLGMLSLTGCQKDNTDNSVTTTPEEQIAFTLSAENTRTIYEDGVGVHMTGDEVVSVLYTYTDGSRITKKDYIAQATKTSANEDGTYVYTFTPNPDSGKTIQDYMFILPYNSDVNFDKGSTAEEFLSQQSLYTIQEPSATSFDANSDVLIGRRTAASEIEEGNANILFKRIFAPLKVTLKGLDSNEKVQAVTIATTGTPNRTENTNVLSGASYVLQSSNYTETVLDKWHSTRYSGGLTANYRAGLEANSEGNFDIWFVANPITLDGIKVCVVTDSRIIERTIDKAVPIAPHKLNSMSINMAGEGATSADAITFNLVGTNDLTTGIPTKAGVEGVTESFSLTGSDGESYTWARTGLTKFYKARGLHFPKDATSYIQLPVFEGKVIQSIRLLQHAATNGTAHDMVLQKLEGEEWLNVETVSVTRNMIEQTNYGYIIFTPTNPEAGATYRISSTQYDTYVSAATIEVTDATEPMTDVDFVSAEKTELTFSVELNSYASKYYYLLQAAEQEAPTAEAVVSTGTVSTATELTINNLAEDTEYILYVVPVGENNAQGALVSAEGKTKSSAIDYYTLYTTNGSVTIGDYTFKAEDWGEAILVTEGNLTKNYLTNGGIVFVEDSETDLSGSDINLTNNLAIIGRYNNQQPTILTKKLKMAANSSCYFVNLAIIDGASDNMFTTEAGSVEEPINTLVLLDCTVKPFKHLVSVNKWSIRKTIIDNCIIKLNNKMGIYIVTSTSIAEQLRQLAEELQVTNCVIYAENDNVTYLVGASEAVRSLPNLTIKFSHNSLYNITRNPYINMYYAKSIEASYNAAYSTNATTAKSFMTVIATDKVTNVGPYNVTNNYGNIIPDDKKYYGFKTCNTNCVVELTDVSRNLFENEESPFISGSIDAANGYFPVNTGVVTKGAGASYETKLWRIWE